MEYNFLKEKSNRANTLNENTKIAIINFYQQDGISTSSWIRRHSYNKNEKKKNFKRKIYTH